MKTKSKLNQLAIADTYLNNKYIIAKSKTNKPKVKFKSKQLAPLKS